MIFLTYILIPLIVLSSCFLFFNHKITFVEFLTQTVIQIFFTALFIFFIYHSNISDFEIIHGQITDKNKIHVSCNHSYDCMCYETCNGTGSSQSCTEHCHVCYEHSYDVDWMIYSDIGSVKINRVDRQGLQEPLRFTIANIGQPFAKNNTYENYIKGSPDSLFKRTGLKEKYKKELFPYFGNVHDYYHVNRLINKTKTFFDTDLLNNKIAFSNIEIGKKQGSLGLVFINHNNSDFFYALEEHWIGGKKNDIIPIISLDKNNKIQWVEIMTWVSDPIFKVKLKNDILNLKEINEKNIDELLIIIEKSVKMYYARKPMKDFDYLKNSIKPSITQYVVGIILLTIISFLMVYLAYKYEWFNRKNNFA